jgi:1,4-alpha-glucan branching enzyme
MNLVLVLHSHLPYVLHHGRWPHGSDWLCEAALDTYLPLLETLSALEAAGVPAPVTLGISPVLAGQLAAPAFRSELEAFFDQRLAACAALPASLAETHDGHLVPLAGYWRGRFERLRRLFHAVDGDLAAAFAALEARGRIELLSSAATHGFLPLLGRDESIRLQLTVGRMEHRRLFRRDPAGCWLPECAYRPRGSWHPDPAARRHRLRRGTDEHLAEAGYRFFVTDAHLAGAGDFLAHYGEAPLGAERFDAERRVGGDGALRPAVRSPYRAYRTPARGVAALVRDPRSSLQVWSRRQGYPGDGAYLEFHKIRWPGGLKLWSVTGGDVDLGAKAPYEPARAQARAGDHAAHFVGLLEGIAGAHRRGRPGVITAPFDAELFGHWWFEGVEFLAALYRRLASGGPVRPVTASQHLAAHPARTTIRLAEGSWGARGDFSMWLNEGTRWTWQRMWPLEDAFWEAAPAALADEARRPVLAQAARELLLAQSSDWQFIISTGAAADYAERRFALHCADAEHLAAALAPHAPSDALEAARRRAAELAERNALFPDILDAVAHALA